MNVFTKLKLLKWCFIFVLFFNIFFMISGVGFIVFYHKANNDTLSSTNELQKVTGTIYSLISDITKVENKESIKKMGLWNKLVKLERSKLKPQSFNWSEQILREGLINFQSSANLTLLKKDLSKWIVNNSNKISKNQESLNSLKGLLIFSLIFSFTFGILLPLLIFSKILRLAFKAQSEFMETVKNLTAQWKSTINNNNTEAFKSVEFWAKTTLTFLKSLSRFNSNPALLLVHDTCLVILDELDNKSIDIKSKTQDTFGKL